MVVFITCEAYVNITDILLFSNVLKKRRQAGLKCVNTTKEYRGNLNTRAFGIWRSNLPYFTIPGLPFSGFQFL